MRPGRMIAQRFEIIERTGSGGMSTVFRARDKSNRDMEVAVKILRARDVLDAGRFEREAAALASLSHPNIVGYIAHGHTDENDPFLAMEWLDHETVRVRLAHGFTVQEAVMVVRQAADALAAAHALGIVHRDVKPENLLLVDHDITRVKLADFGIARPMMTTTSLTKTGAVVGTPGYMSPEQVHGDRVLDGRADVFALGCVLYECLTGVPAFSGANTHGVMVKILHSDPVGIGTLCDDAPPSVIALVNKMLEKSPRDRPTKMAEIAAELAALGPLPDGTRRPASDPAIAQLTRIRGPFSLVMIRAKQGELSREQSQQVEDEARRAGAHVDSLFDGSIVVIMPPRDSPESRAAGAARLSLAVHTAIPGVIVAVGFADPETGDATEAADGAAILLSEAVLRSVFSKLAGADAEGVRIDAPTAALLDRRFRIERGAGGAILLGERPDSR